MNKDILEVAKRATEEQWDAFKIMAEFMSIQKETDAKIAEINGSDDIATKIRNQ